MWAILVSLLFVSVVSGQKGTADEGIAIRLASQTALGGSTIRGNVTLTVSAESKPPDLQLPLTSNNPAVIVPRAVKLSSGDSTLLPTTRVTYTGTFEVRTSPVDQPTTVSITAGEGMSAKSATLKVNPPVLSNFTLASASVTGGKPATGTLALSGTAPSGGFLVRLNKNPTDAWQYVTVPETVTIPAGQKSVTFEMTTTSVAAAKSVEIQAGENAPKSVSLSIGPPRIANLEMHLSNPPSITGGGGSQSVANVVLDVPAPQDRYGGGGSPFSLPLSSSNPTAAPVNDRVRFSANATRGFTISVNPPPMQVDTPVTLTIGEGTDIRTINLTIKPLGVRRLNVMSVTQTSITARGGLGVPGYVFLNAIAPAGGLTVPLSSNHPAVIVPASVTVPAGQSGSEAFHISLRGVTERITATLTAGQGPSSASATITLEPATIQEFGLRTFENSGTNLSVRGGMEVTGYINLDGSPPPDGLTIPLSSSDLAASVPANLIIPSGTTGTFRINTMTVASDVPVTITAGQGANAKTATLTVKAVNVDRFSFISTVPGGSTPNVTVFLTGPATAGFTLPASSSNPAVVSVPASLTFAAGQTEGQLSLTTTRVEQDTPVTITVGQGAAAKTLNITVQPLKVAQLNFSPQSVTGGVTINAEVTINGLAPTGGLTVPLTSSVAAASVPPSVTVPAGQLRASFQITTTTVDADAGGTITAGQGTSAVTKNIVVRKP
jgi:hypothetical protein